MGRLLFLWLEDARIALVMFRFHWRIFVDVCIVCAIVFYCACMVDVMKNVCISGHGLFEGRTGRAHDEAAQI